MGKITEHVKSFCKKADLLLFFLCLAASIFGIIAISTATAYEGSFKYVAVQIAAMIIGIGLFVLFTIIDIDVIADKWAYIFGFCIALIVLLAIFGDADNTGNKSWIRFLGIGIQPSEIIKVAYIVLFAKHITYLKSFKSLNHVFSIAQLVVHFGFFFGILIVVSSDLGNALIFFFIFLCMLFFAGIKLYWFVLGAAGIAALIPFAWNHVLREDQKLRILAPYDSSIDPDGSSVSWQANQSKIALASGRLTGTGIGEGTQTQSGSIPAQHTDFIFAVIGEEMGMIGCLLVFLLLLAIIIRCVYVGLHSGSTLGMLVCVGVAGATFFQMFENIGMCIGLTPVIGITLPFFSYGGSSMFSMFAAMGIVSGVKYKVKPVQFRSYYS